MAHGDVSPTRKIASVVVLVVLIIFGGFYIFKTMFPDKYQAIVNKPTPVETVAVVDQPALNETPAVAQEETQPSTLPAAQTQEPTTTTQEPPAPTQNTTGTPTQQPTQNVADQQITADNNPDTPAPTVAGVTENVPGDTHAAADTSTDTSAGADFDPFAEVEEMLEQPSQYQVEIDTLKDLLTRGEEYFELAELTDDASIRKYSQVLVTKIPVDLQTLEAEVDVDLDEINRHIKLFENYIIKLESISPLN